MTAHVFTLQEWLLALVSAQDDHERRTVGVRACADGYADALVECTRCPVQVRNNHPVPNRMLLPDLVRHLCDVEAAYRQVTPDGPNTAAHGPEHLLAVTLTRFPAQVYR